MTPCPTASRIFQDWSEALREASSPEHRDSEELLTSYAGAVASALDHHLQECPACLSSSHNVDPTQSDVPYSQEETMIRKAGWNWLMNATKWHYFKEDGRSLCGRWYLPNNDEAQTEDKFE